MSPTWTSPLPLTHLRPPDDAPVDEPGQLGQLLVAALVRLIGGVGVPAAQDGRLEPALELAGGAEQALVDEVQQREVLEQVVLDGRARQQHAPLRLQAHQCLVRLILRVLQPEWEGRRC